MPKVDPKGPRSSTYRSSSHRSSSHRSPPSRKAASKTETPPLSLLSLLVPPPSKPQRRSFAPRSAKEAARRRAALASERSAAEAEAVRTTASLRAAAASTISFGFLNSVAGGKTLSVIELVDEPDIPSTLSEYENVAAGGPVRLNAAASDIYTREFPYETTKDLIQVAPELLYAAEQTDKELLKYKDPATRSTTFDSISWIIAYQGRPQEPPERVNYTGQTPTHASMLILLPDGNLYSLGIGVTNKSTFGLTNAKLYSPDVLTVNIRPYIHVAFPFTTFFYKGIEKFVKNYVKHVKMFYRPRTFYSVAGIPRNATISTQFFDMPLKRYFSIPGMRIPHVYEPLNCARGVQEILRGAITVGPVIAHPDMMMYTYGPFKGIPLPEDKSEFIYQLLFGNKRGENNICSKNATFCKDIMDSMPPPSHRGGRRTRRACRRHKPKKN